MKNFKKQATALMLSGAMVFGSVATTLATGNTTDSGLVKVEKTANLRHELNPVSNSMKVVLGVMLDQTQKVKLEVFDTKDNLVHKDVYNTDGFIQMFDLKNLGEGKYIFRITSGNTSYIDKVIVGEQAPSFEAFQAYISEVENEKLKFSYADAKGDVTLSVKEATGKVIFTESLGKDFSSSGIANLSKLDVGEYTIQLSSSTGKETKRIKID